ncbi:MAG: Zn-ribbon domain-containing OB-fold protein [Acidimicrobiia bacterium]
MSGAERHARGVPPQPQPDRDTAGFWEALRGGNLALCRCSGCRTWIQPPLARCRVCGEATAFERVSGEGHVYSFTVVHHAAVPGFTPPYMIALVELAEQAGLRVPALLVEVEPVQVHVAMAVEALVVQPEGSDCNVAVFRPRHGVGSTNAASRRRTPH